MKKSLKIRAHHLICIPRFYSGGYNETFAENMKRICLIIRNNPNIKIKILNGKPDELCMKCPYRCRNYCTQSNGMALWVVEEDRKVIKLLKLKLNSTYIAKDIFNLAMDKINNKTIKSVCNGCIYLNDCIEVGINNTFKEELNKIN